MTNDLSCAFLLAGQLPYVGDQPPAVVPVVDGLHVQHGGLDPGLILQGETQSQTQSLHRELAGSVRLISGSAGSPANFLELLWFPTSDPGQFLFGTILLKSRDGSGTGNSGNISSFCFPLIQTP